MNVLREFFSTELLQLLQLVVNVLGVAVLATWAAVTIWALWSLRNVQLSSWLDEPAHLEPLPFAPIARDGHAMSSPRAQDAAANDSGPGSSSHQDGPQVRHNGARSSPAPRRPCSLCARVRALLKR